MVVINPDDDRHPVLLPRSAAVSRFNQEEWYEDVPA